MLCFCSHHTFNIIYLELIYNLTVIFLSQNGSKRQESQTLESRTVSEINLIKLDVLHEDESLKEDLFSPHNDVEPTGRPLKSVPGEKECCLLQPSLAPL